MLEADARAAVRSFQKRSVLTLFFVLQLTDGVIQQVIFALKLSHARNRRPPAPPGDAFTPESLTQSRSRYTQRVLLVFLGLLVFLLSLVAVAVHFGIDAAVIKKLPAVAIAVSALVIPSRAPAQVTSPDQDARTAPLPIEPPETTGPPAPSAGPDYERPVSWKLLFHNVMADQKQIWLFPARLVRGQNLAPTAAVVGTTTGLFFLDPSEAGYFRGTTTFHGFNRILNGNATAIGMGALSASLYAIGRIRKDSKMQHTALLAGEAMADAAIVQTALKDATMRVGQSVTRLRAGLRPAAHRLPTYEEMEVSLPGTA